MNKVWKKKWLKALRSGKFKQARETLCVASPKGKDSFCCLGVLCELSGNKRRWVEPSDPYDANLTAAYGTPKRVVGEDGGLTAKGRKLFGIDTEKEGQLVTFNDDENRSFKWIARWIEKNL